MAHRSSAVHASARLRQTLRRVTGDHVNREVSRIPSVHERMLWGSPVDRGTVETRRPRGSPAWRCCHGLRTSRLMRVGLIALPTRRRAGQRDAAVPFGSTVFVGAGTLAIRCALLARKMGHVIAAALCGDALFRDWAARADILCVANVEEFSALVNSEPVEWMFSIANPFILPADVFRRVRRGAFNYHDGPLPRYAGTHPTSWALLAQETEYAITWHRIDHGVDTGDLVVQRQVLIGPTDTTLSLTLKCYEAAVEGFRELLTGLTNGTLAARSQALANRSYFPGGRRADASGSLRWDRSAQDLSAMARALEFGLYHSNPLCFAQGSPGE
ncbi:hypothetical protein ABIB80_004960 [Bradyrhizobium sp. i1.15.2]